MSGHSDQWCQIDPCEDCQEEAYEREEARYQDEQAEKWEREREAEAVARVFIEKELWHQIDTLSTDTDALKRLSETMERMFGRK